MTDDLQICPKCSSDACYVSPLNETKNAYFCFGCGFQTNDLMIEGEYDAKEYEQQLPELYKDIKHTDSENRVWYPIVINIKELGTVFINGIDKDNWSWAGILSKPLTEEESKMLSNKGINFKSDPTSLKHFGKDFIEACDYIKIFEQHGKHIIRDNSM